MGPQVGPMLAPWTLFSGNEHHILIQNTHMCILHNQLEHTIPHEYKGISTCSNSTFCETTCSLWQRRNHLRSAFLALVRGIHPWQVDSPHKGPVMQNHLHLISSCTVVIFKIIFLIEKCIDCDTSYIFLKGFHSRGHFDRKLSLAWCSMGTKLLPKPMVTQFTVFPRTSMS